MGGNHHNHDHVHTHDHLHHHDHNHNHAQHHNEKNLSVYDRLMRRIDANAVTLPNTPLIRKVLGILFSPDEAEMASRMPGEIATAGAIAKLCGQPVNKAAKMLESMADRGLLFDFDRNGEKYYMLLPAIPGFIEFSLATERADFPQKEFAALWKQVRENNHFDLFKSLFGINMDTQFGRIVSYEDTIKKNPPHEVLSYDRMSQIIDEADAIGVVYCHCRYERRLNGDEICTHPLEVCMTFNITTDVFKRHNIGRTIEKAEAMDIVAQTEDLGLVHMLDNVQRKPAFMCNCCSCACDMVRSFYSPDEPFNTVMTSSFIASVMDDACTGCGRCAKACPIGAISMKKRIVPEEGMRPLVDESICFGCGVCAKSCNKNALHLSSRKARIITPETAFHRMVITALERGKLADFLLANPNTITQKIGKTMIKTIFSLPPAKKLMLQKSVSSRFINIMMDAAKKSDIGWLMDYIS